MSHQPFEGSNVVRVSKPSTLHIPDDVDLDDHVKMFLRKQEERLSQALDTKLDVLTQTCNTKLDAMMEEIRVLPGGSVPEVHEESSVGPREKDHGTAYSLGVGARKAQDVVPILDRYNVAYRIHSEKLIFLYAHACEKELIQEEATAANVTLYWRESSGPEADE